MDIQRISEQVRLNIRCICWSVIATCAHLSLCKYKVVQIRLDSPLFWKGIFIFIREEELVCVSIALKGLLLFQSALPRKSTSSSQ